MFTTMGTTSVKTTNFAIVIVVVLHVPKSQTLLITNVTKSWHMPICNCKCDYYAFWMKKFMRDELMSTIVYHIQWQMKKNYCMYYWTYMSIFSCKYDYL